MEPCAIASEPPREFAYAVYPEPPPASTGMTMLFASLPPNMKMQTSARYWFGGAAFATLRKKAEAVEPLFEGGKAGSAARELEEVPAIRHVHLSTWNCEDVATRYVAC